MIGVLISCGGSDRGEDVGELSDGLNSGSDGVAKKEFEKAKPFAIDTIKYLLKAIQSREDLSAIQKEFSKSDTSKRINYRAFIFLNRKDIGYVSSSRW